MEMKYRVLLRLYLSWEMFILKVNLLLVRVNILYLVFVLLLVSIEIERGNEFIGVYKVEMRFDVGFSVGFGYVV